MNDNKGRNVTIWTIPSGYCGRTVSWISQESEGLIRPQFTGKGFNPYSMQFAWSLVDLWCVLTRQQTYFVENPLLQTVENREKRCRRTWAFSSSITCPGLKKKNLSSFYLWMGRFIDNWATWVTFTWQVRFSHIIWSFSCLALCSLFTFVGGNPHLPLCKTGRLPVVPEESLLSPHCPWEIGKSYFRYWYFRLCSPK